MKYHFIGDQGVSMRGLKQYMKHLGHRVSGSDLKTGGHDAKNITADIDVVVRTSAVNPGSDGWKEVEEAEKKGILVIKRSQLLGQITKGKKLIAVSGTHGKTTITTMIGLILIEAGLDPTVFVGEGVKEFHNEVLRIGKSEWFVIEACEYDQSFLDFYPTISIVSNIEEEHPDTYPEGLPQIKKTFLEYINHVPDNGLIIGCHEDANVIEVVKRKDTKAKTVFYGGGSGQYEKLNFNLSIPGKHNALNALAAVALSDYLKIDSNISQKVLQKYTGAKRRFELLGNFNGADLIDDYGHHPTEIKATIQALDEKYSDKKKIVIFWPHQYKRIKLLIKEFSEAFHGADKIIIKPIFFVPGRDEKLDISSIDLVGLINKYEKNQVAEAIDTDEKIMQYLKVSLDDSWVVLTMGIPPVYKIIEKLLTLK